jgi:hypothetical protein
MKRTLMIMICLTLAFGVSAAAAPIQTEAAALVKAYKSPKGSFKQPATNKSNSGVTKTQPDSGTKAPGTAASTTPKKSFFGGGGFARGLFLGGIAGLMFGGLFGSMGFIGQMLGLFINVMALVVLFMIIKSVISYFKKRRYNTRRY